MKYYETLDFTRSITGLASSILRHYHQEPLNPSLSEVDKLLNQAPRNLVMLLFDGLGTSILTGHLPEESFMRRHLYANLCSVFPTTTTAAATALETGYYPSQSGYLGWSVFWPSLKKNVHLYPNRTDDGEPAAPVHLAKTELYAPSWVQQIGLAGDVQTASLSENGDIRCTSLEEIEQILPELVARPGRGLYYVYLNHPDHLLHKHGTKAACIQEWLMKADDTLIRLSDLCPDTMFLLTADHGFTDVDPLCLDDYPDLSAMLRYPPSIEPRAVNLFIKEGMIDRFCQRFQEVTGNTYLLLPMDEVLDQQLFGPPPYHPMFRDMLGDILAIAKTPVTFFFNRPYMQSMIAAHGGLTPEELTVPLIVWKSTECTNF